MFLFLLLDLYNFEKDKKNKLNSNLYLISAHPQTWSTENFPMESSCLLSVLIVLGGLTLQRGQWLPCWFTNPADRPLR